MPSNISIKINSILKDLCERYCGSAGEAFDAQVREKFSREGVAFVPHEKWKESIFDEHRKQSADLLKNSDQRVLQNCSEKFTIGKKETNLILVDKPNGSQQWPDFLLIYKNIFLPIEIKSSSNGDIIVWNSGLPKANGVYIYNCKKAEKTTVFLGQHVISDEERDELLKISKSASEHNEKLPNSSWSYYVRDMFNSSQTFFSDRAVGKDKVKKDTALEKMQMEVDALKSAIQDPEVKSKVKKIEKIKKLEVDMESIKEEISQLEFTINHLQNLRIDNEKKVYSYIEELFCHD